MPRRARPAARPGVPHVIWGHGWGQDHRAFLPLATVAGALAHHTLLDFPGFGGAPGPDDWDTADYADAVAEWLGTLPQAAASRSGIPSGARRLRLAANHPESVDGMVLVAGAGLKRRRSLRAPGIALRCAPSRRSSSWSGSASTSRPARRASARPIIAMPVRCGRSSSGSPEDQTEVARRIGCKVTLFYGGATPRRRRSSASASPASSRRDAQDRSRPRPPLHPHGRRRADRLRSEPDAGGLACQRSSPPMRPLRLC